MTVDSLNRTQIFRGPIWVCAVCGEPSDLVLWPKPCKCGSQAVVSKQEFEATRERERV